MERLGLSMAPVQRQASLRMQVTDALRRALIAGDLKPGHTYSAPDLASPLGVSPTPVREAMQELAKEGLVEPIRNRGFLVTDLSEEDYAALTELRLLIEVPMTGKVAREAPIDDIERLRPDCQTILKVAKRNDLVEYVNLDRAFHLALLALGGNPFVVESVGQLRNRSRLALLQSRHASRGVLQKAAEEHLELLDLLASRDADGAEQLMCDHIQGIGWSSGDEPSSAG